MRQELRIIGQPKAGTTPRPHLGAAGAGVPGSVGGALATATGPGSAGRLCERRAAPAPGRGRQGARLAATAPHLSGGAIDRAAGLLRRRALDLILCLTIAVCALADGKPVLAGSHPGTLAWAAPSVALHPLHPVWSRAAPATARARPGLARPPDHAPAIADRPAPSDSAALCEGAADAATRAHDLPEGVLRAIALVETGQDRGSGLRPWPWAVHAHGRGHWFPTRTEAEAFLATVPPSGVGIDIGCFQINTRWHGQAFDGPAAMLAPAVGADHAARYLRKLHDRLGDWDAAVAAYHSRRPEAAAQYLARYHRARSMLAVTGTIPAPTPDAPAPLHTTRTAPGTPASALTGGIPWR